MSFFRQSALTRRIDSPATAQRIIQEAGMAYYGLAAIQAVIALMAQSSVWIDAVLAALLGFWLSRFQSKLAALLLLLLAIIVFGATITNQPGAMIQGRNALVGLFMLWTSARAVEATFKLGGVR